MWHLLCGRRQPVEEECHHVLKEQKSQDLLAQTQTSALDDLADIIHLRLISDCSICYKIILFDTCL